MPPEVSLPPAQAPLKGQTVKLIVMGTGPFAVPMFRALLESPHTVSLLVTQPPRATRGKKAPPPSPMREVALERQVHIFDPEKINTPEGVARLRAEAAELLVVADYGQILSDDVLGAVPRGGINLHGSLLPKYRGAAPINWAIFHGEPTAGVSVIGMTPRIDAGPVLAQASTPILPAEDAVALEHRLAELGGPLILQTIDRLAAGEMEPLPQDPALATKAPRLKKSDGEVDFHRSPEQIRNQFRAFQPWPGLFTSWLRPQGEPLRLIIGGISPVSAVELAQLPARADSLPPGTVLDGSGDRLLVTAGAGAVELLQVQPAGKRMLSAAEFLRGYPIQPGERLGPAPSESEPSAR